MPRVGPIIVLALVAAACGGGAPDPSEATPRTSTPTSLAPTTTIRPSDTTGTGPTTTNSVGETPVEVAAADLQERLGTSEDPVVVLSEDVTWRNGSLGCPKPGESYTQAIVPGYRIVLEVDGTRFEYHGANGQPPFYCAEPSAPLPPGGGED